MCDGEDAYRNRIVAFDCEQSIKHARLGYLFVNGGLTADEAEDIIHHCQPISGWFPIEAVSVDDVIEAAAYRWSNPADEIRPLAEAAVRRVWNKWCSTGDVVSAAEDWAMDLIEEYAGSDGVELVEGER